jgi:FkbM family methyltransferase
VAANRAHSQAISQGAEHMSPISINLARAFLRLPFELGRWRVERFIANWAKAHPGRKTVTVAGGSKMTLDTSDFLQRTLFAAGDFEPQIRQVIQKRLKPGDTFVDIGANVGFYSLCASKAVGPSGKVFAFEPAPATMSVLRTNISLNRAKNIQATQVALSDHTGETKLFLDTTNNSGATSLRASQNASQAVTVMLDSYDQYAAQHHIPTPALVKIDVEGAESQVLRGMSNLLSQTDRPAMVIEISELSLTQIGSSKEELFAIMVKNGYRSTLLSQPRQSIYSGASIFFQYDVLFEPAL